jgi:hypothetical protein
VRFIWPDVSKSRTRTSASARGDDDDDDDDDNDDDDEVVVVVVVRGPSPAGSSPRWWVRHFARKEASFSTSVAYHPALSLNFAP